jgi:hypothetical protein
MTTSLIADRVSMLEKNPAVLKAILGRQSRNLTTTISYQAHGPPAPLRIEPLGPQDAALSNIISLYRAIPRYNLAHLLLASPQRADARRSRPGTIRKEKKQHVSLGKQPFPVLTHLIRSSHDYPLSKDDIIKKGSLQAAEVRPAPPRWRIPRC